jgi:transcription antitermination protein NusB
MFNRRLLRIKALQTYYSYAVSKDANFNLSHELIAETFSPDLNSMEFQDKKLLNQQKVEVGNALNDWLAKGIKNNLEETKLSESLDKAINTYLKRNDKDLATFSKNLVEQTESTFYWYIFTLQLAIEVAKLVLTEEDDKRNKLLNNKPSEEHELKLGKSTILAIIENNQGFKTALINKKIGLQNELQLLRSIYKNAVKTDEKYKEFVAKKEVSQEEEMVFIKHFFNQIILKSTDLADYMETQEIHWAEDKAVIKDMIGKTLKHIQNNDKDILAALSANWEDDKEFMLLLLKETIAMEAEIEKETAPKMKNWDMERVALSDKLILNMAIAEMLTFPSIPVKVTINEYIELSKNYSTPKSKDFINGILDNVSNAMIKSGKIKKSGRGLMDNK